MDHDQTSKNQIGFKLPWSMTWLGRAHGDSSASPHDAQKEVGHDVLSVKTIGKS